MSTAFQRGQFRTMRATNKIHLGRYAVDILGQDEFDFDGYTVRYGGTEYTVPQLRNLLGDWFVPSSDQTTVYRSKPAGVQVSFATPEARERNERFDVSGAFEEEALVGTVDELEQIRVAARDGNVDRLAELRDRQQTRKASIGHVDTNPGALPPQNADDVDEEVEAALMEQVEESYVQGRPVHVETSNTHQVSSAEQEAMVRAEAINRARIAKIRADLESRDPPKTREEMGVNSQSSFEQSPRRVGAQGKYTLVEEDSDGVPVGKKYKFSDGATVGAGVVEAGTVKAINVLNTGATQPIQVGNAVTTTPVFRQKTGAQVIDDPMDQYKPQGYRSAQSTQILREGNVGIDEIHENGATGDVAEARSGDDLVDLFPDAAVAGLVARKKPAPLPAKTEDEEIAELAEGWSTKRNWQKRVEEAVDFYGDWPEALDAICAKESPKVVEMIRKKLDAQKI